MREGWCSGRIAHGRGPLRTRRGPYAAHGAEPYRVAHGIGPYRVAHGAGPYRAAHGAGPYGDGGSPSPDGPEASR